MIEVGTDDNGNGMLDYNEIDPTEYVWMELEWTVSQHHFHIN